MQLSTRRRAIKMGALVAGSVSLSMTATGFCATVGNRQRASPIMLGRHDLDEVWAIDSHIHDPHPMDPMEAILAWGRSFAASALEIHGATGEASLTGLAKRYTELFEELPSSIGLRQYIARRYNVPSDIESVSAVVKQQIAGGTTSYYRREWMPVILHGSYCSLV